MERDWIARLSTRLVQPPQLVLGVGDDAALWAPTPGKELVVTTDLLAEGSHFTATEGYRRIGHKALAVNLSDLAAMAAEPRGAVVSLLLPQEGSDTIANELYAGLLPLAERYDVAIAGGDYNTWAGPLVINVAVWGEATPGRAWRRTGAQPGDLLMVTGALGGSILGKHLDFEPRVTLALSLAQTLEVHAAMDLSDGLSLDLARLAEASAVGALIYAAAIPIAAAAEETSQRGLVPRAGSTPLEHALHDGEDFELLLAVPRKAWEGHQLSPELAAHCHPIGVVTEPPGIWLVHPDGQQSPLQPRGYQHGNPPRS